MRKVHDFTSKHSMALVFAMFPILLARPYIPTALYIALWAPILAATTINVLPLLWTGKRASRI